MVDIKNLISPKVYRYGLSITTQFYFCGIPFRLDTSSKCNFGCTYCFSSLRGGRRTSEAFNIDVLKFRKKLKNAFKKKSIGFDINTEMLSQRIPIHFGGVSEPFSDPVTSSLTKELLKILKEYNYPLVISTKNPAELLNDSYLKVLSDYKNIAIQVSISSPDNKFSKLVEPSAPSPEERVNCIQSLTKEGFYCIARVQPVFFSEINKVAQDLIPMLSSTGCSHVILEYLKLPVEKNNLSFNAMLNSINWDAYDFYKKNMCILVGREWLLPNKFKLENLQPIINSIHKRKLTYGAGDYGLHHLGDTDCCCGIDKLDGFNNWFKGNISNIIRKSRSNFLEFPEVLKFWFPKKSIKMYLNSNCRLGGDDHRIIRYLREKWNSPGTVNSPDSYLGINWNGVKDEFGNIIYEKNLKEVIY